MLLHIVGILDELLVVQKDLNPDLTLQLVFFDSYRKENEAVFGSSFLANKWEENNQLESIYDFVLLSILGNGPVFIPNHAENNAADFAYLRSIEKRLIQAKLIEKHDDMFSKLAPQPLEWSSYSDHLPFFSKLVPVLNLTGEKLTTEHGVDLRSVQNMCLIITVFLNEYLCT